MHVTILASLVVEVEGSIHEGSGAGDIGLDNGIKRLNMCSRESRRWMRSIGRHE